MTKKKDTRILGPDGKPYVPPPKPPEAKVGVVRSGTTEFTATFAPGAAGSLWARMFGLTGVPVRYGHEAGGANAPDFREAVAEQVSALTEGFDGVTVAELPEPPRDLTTYADAYASAAKKCDHPDAVEMLHGRQWVCDLCGRTLNRDDMRRAGRSQWWWS